MNSGRVVELPHGTFVMSVICGIGATLEPDLVAQIEVPQRDLSKICVKKKN
jgi:hypothetical protein